MREGGRGRGQGGAHLHDVIDLFAINVEDGALEALGHVRAVEGRSTLVPLVSGEPELEGGGEGGGGRREGGREGCV